MRYPVNEPIITSDWAVLRTLPDGKNDVHGGIDYISGSGDRNVFAVSNGFVAYDYDDYCDVKRYQKPNTGGNMVIITSVINNKTYHIRYLHLVKNYVVKGQFIPEGTLIGFYGDVGYSFGAHLHLDIYTHDWSAKVNPHELGL